jgi:capsid protein
MDEFLEANDWVGDFERELFVRSRRDGEFFLALSNMSQGPVAARVLEPEQITEPQNCRAIEDWLGTDRPSSWSFGIHTDASDVQHVYGYHVRWNESGSDWDYLDASRVEHVKLNVDRNVKRGVSDFYAVRAHLEGVEKLLRNTREGAAVQAAIAFIREHAPGSSAGQIHSLAALNSVTDYTQPTKTGSRTRYVTRYEPGTILDVAGGMQYKPGPLGASHGPNFIAIGQAVMRTIGTRWCMPEYMVSGDASNANYSSSLVAESPFVRACEAEQRFFISRFRKILWKVIALAATAGRFARWNVDFETLRALVAIQIEAPTIAVRDQLAEAQTSEIEHRNGVLSKRTWAALAGRDYDTEQVNLLRESEQTNFAKSKALMTNEARSIKSE